MTFSGRVAGPAEKLKTRSAEVVGGVLKLFVCCLVETLGQFLSCFLMEFWWFYAGKEGRREEGKKEKREEEGLTGEGKRERKGGDGKGGGCGEKREGRERGKEAAGL